MLQSENDKLRLRVKALAVTVDALKASWTVVLFSKQIIHVITGCIVLRDLIHIAYSP